MTHGDSPTIDLSADVTPFFREVVTTAVRDRGYAPTEAAETYLVAMLADYAKPDQLSDETLCRPLTLLLDEALNSTGHERFERLRTLGDGVLYVSGFFGDHLQTKGVERDYVTALGARAYDGAARMIQPTVVTDVDGASDLFSELSAKFEMFVQVLTDVAHRFHARAAKSDGAVLRLYERWLRTGSAPLADALTSRGLMPVRGSGMVH